MANEERFDVLTHHFVVKMSSCQLQQSSKTALSVAVDVANKGLDSHQVLIQGCQIGNTGHTLELPCKNGNKIQMN